MAAFLIVATAIYILLASTVAKNAKSNGRDPLQWFFAALVTNTVIAHLLRLSHISGSRLAAPEVSGAPDAARLSAASQSAF